MTVLYRAFDQDDKLLYVGITDRIDQRIGAHGRTSPWAGDVARWAVEAFQTRAEAEAAEASAISAESPMHNVTFTGKPRARSGEDEAAVYVAAIQSIMREVGISQTALAAGTGINQPTLSRKFSGVRQFYLGEIIQICNLLGVSLEEMTRRAAASKDAA